MFNEAMEHVNLRLTIGACRDFDCDVNEVRSMKDVELGNIRLNMAPEDYYSKNVTLNCLPMSWFDIMTGAAVT